MVVSTLSASGSASATAVPSAFWAACTSWYLGGDRGRVACEWVEAVPPDRWPGRPRLPHWSPYGRGLWRLPGQSRHLWSGHPAAGLRSWLLLGSFLMNEKAAEALYSCSSIHLIHSRFSEGAPAWFPLESHTFCECLASLDESPRGKGLALAEG